MPSRPARFAGAILYALVVFSGTAALGFGVAPAIGHAAGLFPIESEAQAAFSLLTLKAIPLLAGFSSAAAFSYDWWLGLSGCGRLVAYGATVLLAWVVGATVAGVLLG